jgi:FemAB-related protein (PEP-CTERM system-associated)
MPTETPILAERLAQAGPVAVAVHRYAQLPEIRVDWDASAAQHGYAGFFHRAAWGEILKRSLGHEPYFLSARRAGEITGILPLVFVRSLLFGRFLVGMSYVNTGGVLSDDAESAAALIDRALDLADELQAQHLELRHEREIPHPRLTETMTEKVHMRLALPKTSDELMAGFKSKLRSQVKKALTNGQVPAWGGTELLDGFYAVFSRNMRDLGTPVFPRALFAEILREFPDDAELCVLRDGSCTVAAALLIHGPGVTQVPSASALREFNATNANMRMYWHLLERATERGQQTFDFGRSTRDSGPYRFKEQWGAEPLPAVWQYSRRMAGSSPVRRENSKYERMIRAWQRLPLGVANWLGPRIVRGIP